MRSSSLSLVQEFVVQHNENANPPTFFLTLETLVQRMQREDKMVGMWCGLTYQKTVNVCVQDVAFLRRVFPRLQVWFDWFNETQVMSINVILRIPH